MISLVTKLKTLRFHNPICNASGVYSKTGEELLEMFLSRSGSIITKSSTLTKRNGNPHPAYWEDDKISINSMGLPNHGYKYYCDFIKEMPRGEKHCFMSIANVDNNDTAKVLTYIQDKSYISYPEINVSCPNIPGKEQLGYNTLELDRFLDIVDKHYKKPYGLKMPPYFDPVHIANVSEVILRHPNIHYLTCINSVGNALDINTTSNTVRIRPKHGLGGLGGDFILPVALSNVFQFKTALPHIDIIGCGGIRTGEDVYKHILAGASMVQIGTTLNREGTGCITRILDELKKEMYKHNYKMLDDFRGKLHELI